MLTPRFCWPLCDRLYHFSNISQTPQIVSGSCASWQEKLGSHGGGRAPQALPEPRRSWRAWDFSLPIAERPVFLQHQAIFSANARPDPGDSPRSVWFLKQMFPDHMKGWQSITVGFTMPSFVKIPNIRKWGLGIEGSISLQPPPLPGSLTGDRRASQEPV